MNPVVCNANKNLDLGFPPQWAIADVGKIRNALAVSDFEYNGRPWTSQNWLHLNQSYQMRICRTGFRSIGIVRSFAITGNPNIRMSNLDRKTRILPVIPSDSRTGWIAAWFWYGETNCVVKITVNSPIIWSWGLSGHSSKVIDPSSLNETPLFTPT